MESNKVLLKQMTIQFLGDSQNYEHFRRMVEASPHLYTHDFTFYNDCIQKRHQRNLAQISKIKALIEKETIVPGMLSHNTFNTFYPGYILHHHYSVFLPLSATYFPKQLTPHTKPSSGHFLGAYLQTVKSNDLKRTKEVRVLLNSKGQLEMDQDLFFFSAHTNPYLSHALIIAEQNGKKVLAIVSVRQKVDHLCQGVSVFDFGGTISNDYLSVGYNFHKAEPLAVVELNNGISKVVGKTALKQLFDQFNFSLKDLQKSLWITVHYTAMRTQFKTLPDSRQERPISQYQAVSGRIIENFALFTAFSDLNARLIQSQKTLLFYFNDLLLSSHHLILQSLISLRQCCGGFGFLQVSGHPGCIQRAGYRAGQESTSRLSFSKQFLKATQFYTSSEELLKFYSQEITQPKINYLQIFGLFLSICESMRQRSQTQGAKQYKREYLRQSAIMAMHAREEFLRYEATNVHCQLLQFLVYSYIIKNARFINWNLLKVTKQVLVSELTQQISILSDSLTKNIPTLTEALELGFLRNVVIGRPDQQSFYTQLVKVSKQNLRNHEQFARYVREPIAEMLTRNNASL